MQNSFKSRKNAMGISRERVRDSNFELLRIIAMFLIVLHHFSVHGLWAAGGSWVTEIPNHTVVIACLAIGGKVGVDLFVLITGYFMVRQRFRAKSLFRIIAESWFYAMVVLFAIFVYKPDAITGSVIVQSVTPLVFLNWFVGVYAALYILIPFLNKLIFSMAHSAYKHLLVLLFIVFSLIPSIEGFPWLESKLGWFIFLYLLGGYIRLFNIKIRTESAVSIGMLCMIVLVVWTYAYHTQCININALQQFAPYQVYVASDSFVLTLLISISIFLLFNNINIGSISAVNIVSSAALGVYLLSDNDFVRSFLWDRFGNVYYSSALSIIATGFVASAVIYCVCMIIDFGRQRFIEAPFFSLIDRHFPAFFSRIDKWMEKGLGNKERDGIQGCTHDQSTSSCTTSSKECPDYYKNDL